MKTETTLNYGILKPRLGKQAKGSGMEYYTYYLSECIQCTKVIMFVEMTPLVLWIIWCKNLKLTIKKMKVFYENKIHHDTSACSEWEL